METLPAEKCGKAPEPPDYSRETAAIILQQCNRATISIRESSRTWSEVRLPHLLNCRSSRAIRRCCPEGQRKNGDKNQTNEYDQLMPTFARQRPIKLGHYRGVAPLCRP